MTITTRQEVKTLEEATAFLGKIHAEYMMMIMTRSGTFNKKEKWDLKNGQGYVEVVITTEDED